MIYTECNFVPNAVARLAIWALLAECYSLESFKAKKLWPGAVMPALCVVDPFRLPEMKNDLLVWSRDNLSFYLHAPVLKIKRLFAIIRRYCEAKFGYKPNS